MNENQIEINIEMIEPIIIKVSKDPVAGIGMAISLVRLEKKLVVFRSR